MPANERDVEALKVAAMVAAVQAYLELEARGGRAKPAAIRHWRRDAEATGVDGFTERHRTWTGRS